MLFRVGNTEATEKAGPVSSAFASVYLNRHCQKLESAKEISRLPQDGECHFLQTMQAFNAFTLVQLVARLQYIDELCATTYSVSMRVMESLQEMQQQGRIGQIKLLVSDSMMKRNPRVTDSLDAWANSNANVSVIYTWNHSKITLARAGENHYCIEGSGNWSENACYEQYVFLNSKEVYDFRRSLFDDCKVVRKIN